MNREKGWTLFRIAGSSLDEFWRQCSVLEARLSAGGSWCGGIVGSGVIRDAFVAGTTDEALRVLALKTADRNTRNASSSSPNIAFVFPGLGGELVERFSEMRSLSPAFARTLARADRVTSERFGRTVTELAQLHGSQDRERGKARRLFRAAPAAVVPPTLIAHCLLYTIECALAQTWIDWGVRPRYVMGYSLGEFSAACIAGLFSFEAGLALLIDRAQMLAELPPSGMIAVSAGHEAIAAVLQVGMHLVGENSPTQTILGGDRQALTRATQILRARGHVVQELPVEHAFHTPLMRPVASRLHDLFSRLETQTPHIHLISTLTGAAESAASLQHPAHWQRQLCEPVRLREALHTLDRLDIQVFLEVGPGQALAPIIESQLQDASRVEVLTTMPGDYDTRPAAGHLLRTVGHLWTLGVSVEAIPSIPVFEPHTVDQLPAGDISATDEALIHTLREIWSSALGRHDVRVDGNLFDLGASSLKVARIAMLVKRQLHAELTLRDIYSSPTPRQLAGLIAEGQRLRTGHTDLMSLPNGLTIRCQSRAEAAYFYRSIFEERCYLRHGLRLDPGATVVDVGANIGLFSIFAALEAPGVRLYSFEPVPPLFDLLRFNMADICEDAAIFNVGISDESGQAIITYYPNSPGMSSFLSDRAAEQAVLEAILRNSSAGGDALAGEILQDRADFMESRFQTQYFPCALRTLTDVFEEHGLVDIDLLKIDVQKLELKVLQGISDHLWTGVRQAVIEVHDHDGRVRAVQNLLQSRGFNVTVEQDYLYKGTDIHNLYASR